MEFLLNTIFRMIWRQISLHRSGHLSTCQNLNFTEAFLNADVLEILMVASNFPFFFEFSVLKIATFSLTNSEEIRPRNRTSQLSLRPKSLAFCSEAAGQCLGYREPTPGDRI